MDQRRPAPAATGALSPVSSDWSNRLAPGDDLAVGGQPLARSDAHHHARARGRAPPAIASAPFGATTIAPGAAWRSSASTPARARSRIAASSARPASRNSSSISVPSNQASCAAGHRLVEAERGGERHADRDRHVHVGAPAPQRRPGRGEERPPGIGDRGHADQRREPVEQLARASLPRPTRCRPTAASRSCRRSRRPPAAPAAALPPRPAAPVPRPRGWLAKPIASQRVDQVGHRHRRIMVDPRPAGRRG